MMSTSIKVVTAKHFLDACEMEWPNFAEVLVKPSELHLLVTTWYADHCSDYEIELRQRHAYFNANLNNKWLEPVQSHLTHLSLHCNTYWGIYPRWQPGSLHFPRLRLMSFGQWTIFYDWQVEFITSHGETLEQLILVNCPILHALCMTTRQSNNLWQQRLGGTGRGKPPTTNIYSDLRWHTVLPALTAGLPKLKHFSMGRGPTRDRLDDDLNFDSDRGFEDRYTSAPKIDSSRYAMFTYCRGVTEWSKRSLDIEGNGKFRSWANPRDWGTGEDVERRIQYPDCLQEDENTLEDLLKIASARQVVADN
jgi:hypothetical protein